MSDTNPYHLGESCENSNKSEPVQMVHEEIKNVTINAPFIICSKHGKTEDHMTLEFTNPKLTFCLHCLAEFLQSNFKSYEIQS